MRFFPASSRAIALAVLVATTMPLSSTPIAAAVPSVPPVHVVCPALGPRQDAIEFFESRGLHGTDVVVDGDVHRWEASKGPFEAVVQGADLADLISLDALFVAEPSDPDTAWFWSSVELADAFRWSEELFAAYAYSRQVSLESVVLQAGDQNWPGTSGAYGPERRGSMSVSIEPDGLHVAALFQATHVDDDDCQPT